MCESSDIAIYRYGRSLCSQRWMWQGGVTWGRHIAPRPCPRPDDGASRARSLLAKLPPYRIRHSIPSEPPFSERRAFLNQKRLGYCHEYLHIRLVFPSRCQSRNETAGLIPAGKLRAMKPRSAAPGLRRSSLLHHCPNHRPLSALCCTGYELTWGALTANGR